MKKYILPSSFLILLSIVIFLATSPYQTESDYETLQRTPGVLVKEIETPLAKCKIGRAQFSYEIVLSRLLVMVNEDSYQYIKIFTENNLNQNKTTNYILFDEWKNLAFYFGEITAKNELLNYYFTTSSNFHLYAKRDSNELVVLIIVDLQNPISNAIGFKGKDIDELINIFATPLR